MKKYAAGGKCGTMSSSSCDNRDGVKEVNDKLSAALAERAKQDALFSSAQAKPEQQNQTQAQKAIVIREAAPTANQKYSDIDLILSGDFQEED